MVLGRLSFFIIVVIIIVISFFSGHWVWRFLELKAWPDIGKILLLPEFHEADINLFHKLQAGYCFKHRLWRIKCGADRNTNKRFPNDTEQGAGERTGFPPHLEKEIQERSPGSQTDSMNESKGQFLLLFFPVREERTKDLIELRRLDLGRLKGPRPQSQKMWSLPQIQLLNSPPLWTAVRSV